LPNDDENLLIAPNYGWNRVAGLCGSLNIHRWCGKPLVLGEPRLSHWRVARVRIHAAAEYRNHPKVNFLREPALENGGFHFFMILRKNAFFAKLGVISASA